MVVVEPLDYNLIGMTMKRHRYSWSAGRSSGTLIVLQRNLNLSAFHHVKEVE